ncbi:MAG TPA: gluconate 2-dehydrogenase subunit 3 family protein [Flavihumibacter sp.]|jgi:hypothetical protein
MDRRQVIRYFLVAGAGMAFLPSCVQNQQSGSIKLKSIQLNADQEQFLKELADAIIPPTDTPGAVELGAHLFALKMVDDCFTKDAQAEFLAGLKSVYKQKADPAALEAAAQQNQRQEELNFLNAFRRLVIQGYTESEYVMTNLLPWKLVPGKYYGCVPVSSI